MKVIKILKEQYNRLFEGLQYKTNSDGSISATIDHDRSDNANAYADTRFFGNKNDLLHGDGTRHGRSINFDSYMKSMESMMKSYYSLYQYAKNGMKDDPNIYTDQYTNSKTLKAINDHINSVSNPVELMDYAKNQYDRLSLPYNIRKNKYERYKNFQPNSKNKGLIPKYNISVVPGTNAKLISLFEFDDFNFSDVIKHGYLRQNYTTDKLLGITPDQREKDFKLGKGGMPYKNIGITYDNGVVPNIYDTFSLKGDYSDNIQNTNDFGRKSYPLNGGSERTSVGGFVDKAIMAASYVLKKENIHPSYILDAPSSSKFNSLFCYRLSLKTGIPFENDFFKRNVIECYINEDEMRKDGKSQADIEMCKAKIVGAEKAEIASILLGKVQKFVKNNRNLFLKDDEVFKMGNGYGNQDTQDLTDKYACRIIANYLYDFISENILPKDNNVAKILASEFIFRADNLTKGKDTDRFVFILNRLFNNRKSRPVVNAFLKDFINTYHSFVNKISQGYKPNFFANKFKITHIDGRFRKYLRNVYIVANRELNNDNQLFTRFKNSKFLIFDDDINSGGTFELLISALRNYGIRDSQVCCLANAYSPNGR